MPYKREEIPKSFYKPGGRGWNADSIKLGLHKLLAQTSKEYLRRYSLPLWSPETNTNDGRDRLQAVIDDLVPTPEMGNYSFRLHFAATIYNQCRFINVDYERTYPNEDQFEAVRIALYSNIDDTLSNDHQPETSEEEYVIEARRILDGIEEDVTNAADAIIDQYVKDDTLKSRTKDGGTLRALISQNITNAACHAIMSVRAELQNEYTNLRSLTHEIQFSGGNNQYCDIFSLQLALLFHKIREIYPYWKPAIEDCTGFSGVREAFYAYEEYGEAELVNIMESQLINAVQNTFDLHWKQPEMNFLDAMWAREDGRMLQNKPTKII